MGAAVRLSVVLVLLACGGCAAHGGAERVAEDGRVSHVVICWLMEPGDEEARARVIEATKRLSEIPGVVSVDVGPVLASARPVVDSSYDVGIVITFADERALRAYDDHPAHRQVVREVIGPLVERFVVYDFVQR